MFERFRGLSRIWFGFHLEDLVAFGEWNRNIDSKDLDAFEDSKTLN